jgi:hypothetical protein
MTPIGIFATPQNNSDQLSHRPRLGIEHDLVRKLEYDLPGVHSLGNTIFYEHRLCHHSHYVADTT